VSLIASVQAAFTHSRNLDQPVEILKNITKSRLLFGTCEGGRNRIQAEEHYARILKCIKNLNDIKIFCFVCHDVMIPLNQTIYIVPTNNQKFFENIAQSFLNQQSENGLMIVINLWDKLKIEDSLNVEGMQVYSILGKLRRKLLPYSYNEVEADMILTAFVQEFERRVGQKRKSRGGRSLEDVTSFILDYFGIPTTHAPDHFQADIEVDKWVKTSDNWHIGISCKRTLRERWKQVSSADTSAMGRYKIKELWHVVTHANTLSDDMLALLGGNRHIFYLPDNSGAYLTASEHPVLRNYVRPLTHFVKDLRAENPKD